MTGTTLSATYSPPKIAPGYLARFTTGASEQCAFVEQKTLETFGQTDLQKFTRALLSKLADYFVPDWDGEGAKPISYNAIINCAVFLAKIAEQMPKSVIQVDPDGWISLEWYADQSNLLEISFGPSDMATYSALIGSKGHCGEIDLLDKGISRSLSALFEDLYGINSTISHTG